MVGVGRSRSQGRRSVGLARPLVPAAAPGARRQAGQQQSCRTLGAVSPGTRQAGTLRAGSGQIGDTSKVPWRGAGPVEKRKQFIEDWLARGRRDLAGPGRT